MITVNHVVDRIVDMNCEEFEVIDISLSNLPMKLWLEADELAAVVSEVEETLGVTLPDIGDWAYDALIEYIEEQNPVLLKPWW